MTEIDETTLAGVARAAISFARDNGYPIEPHANFWLAIADLMQVPDDALFIPAVEAAARTPTRLDDPASIAFTSEVAIAAGYGKLDEEGLKRKAAEAISRFNLGPK
jgi:hypothetical protein